MSQISDDLTPRPAPCPSENISPAIMPSVPDVSIVFEPGNSNNIRPQCFLPSPNFSRPIFNRPAKFEPIVEQDHPSVMSPPPVVFGHKVEYHQQYLNHQNKLLQQSETKQQYSHQQQQSNFSYQTTQQSVPQPHTCTCQNIKLSSTPHIVSVQSHNEIKPAEIPADVQPPTPKENLEFKQILDILKHNQSELRQINENNERNRQLSENLLLELQNYKKTITTILNKQNAMELKISEIEMKMNDNFNEIKTIISTKLNNIKNSNNCEVENRQILPKYANRPIFNNRTGNDTPNKFILSDCKNSPIFAQQKSKSIERNSPVNDADGQANGDMKELFSKYEIKGTLNRRTIDYSVSSLNYLQRYGLLEEHK